MRIFRRNILSLHIIFIKRTMRKEIILIAALSLFALTTAVAQSPSGDITARKHLVSDYGAVPCVCHPDDSAAGQIDVPDYHFAFRQSASPGDSDADALCPVGSVCSPARRNFRRACGAIMEIRNSFYRFADIG
mgnify:CR=1 FL=1